jgi:hypothetical protein
MRYRYLLPKPYVESVDNRIKREEMYLKELQAAATVLLLCGTK